MRPTPTALLCILLTILFTVAGQLLVKKGMMEVGGSPSQLVRLPRFLFSAFTNGSVLAGLGCAFLAAVTWTLAVSRTALSFAYPFMGLAIVLTLALSGLFFGEKVPAQRWIGVALVCLGIFVAARSK